MMFRSLERKNNEPTVQERAANNMIQHQLEFALNTTSTKNN